MKGIGLMALMWVLVLAAWPVHYVLGIPGQLAFILVGLGCGLFAVYLLSKEAKP